jgi:hypothetical protein
MPRWFEARQSGRPGAIAVPTEPVDPVQTAAGIGLEFPVRESDCSGHRPAWYPFSVNVCDGEFDPADPDLTGRQMSTDPARW